MLPGGGDTSVAACYMLGGTADTNLSAVVASWDLTSPRGTRVKAAERVWKDQVKELIAGLNARGGRESRAENLAALRVCEVIADVLDGWVVREMYEGVRRRDSVIDELRREIEELRRGQGNSDSSEITR